VTTAQRSPAATDLPTMQEEGVPAAMSIWNAILVASATPLAQRDAIHAAIVKALGNADLKQRFTGFGMDQIPTLNQADTARFIAAEVERWEGLLKETMPPSPR